MKKIQKIYIKYPGKNLREELKLHRKIREICFNYGYSVKQYPVDFENQQVPDIPDAYLSDIFPLKDFCPDSLIDGFFQRLQEPK